MPLFRLLHISDLHIGETPQQLGFLPFVKAGFALSSYTGMASVSSHDENILEGLALLAWNERNNLDAIVITGDLATTGVRADLEAADRFLYEPHSSSDPHLAVGDYPTLNNPAPLNIYLIPGNHDRYEGKFHTPAGTVFDDIFGPGGRGVWPGGQAAHALDVLRKGGAALGIIGADFSLRTAMHIKSANPGLYLGAGRAHRDVTDELIRLTNVMRQAEPDIEVVWLAHFPPRFPNLDPCLPLLAEDRLVQAAFRAQVNYLLTGHTHEEARYAVLDTVHSIYGKPSFEVFCAGTATEYRLPGAREPRTAHLLEFDITPGSRSTLKVSTLTWPQSGSYWM